MSLVKSFVVFLASLPIWGDRGKKAISGMVEKMVAMAIERSLKKKEGPLFISFGLLGEAITANMTIL